MKRWFVHSLARNIGVLLLVLFACLGPVFAFAIAWAAETAVLKGRVSDAEGRAVEGARIFVYDSPEVRRPAAFISSSTDKDGMFRLTVSPGKYWAVARVKKTEDYGPLLPGDRHSGEALEGEIASGSEITLDFIVADLKEAIKIKTKSRERPFRVSGRILDEQGVPVAKTYVFASRNEKIEGIPEYLSAWVDEEGRYTLYLPAGRYYLGRAGTFPPGHSYVLQGEITIDGDRYDLDIVRTAGGDK